MRLHKVLLTAAALSAGCSTSTGKHTANGPAEEQISQPAAENPWPGIGAIPPPPGFSRTPAVAGSFTGWLRSIPLKKNRTVYLYNGQPMPNQQAQFAVLDIPVGSSDLQQCADAVMRLRAEYLYTQQRYSEILFRDNEGGRYQFAPPYSRTNFERYLLRVFGMCGSASLEKQLRPADWQQLQPGHVLIRGGFPGHAVIVVDVAVNEQGEKRYLLAQSYMPAQDIHILLNPSAEAADPWYAVPGGSIVSTPEWFLSRISLNNGDNSKGCNQQRLQEDGTTP